MLLPGLTQPAGLNAAFQIKHLFLELRHDGEEGSVAPAAGVVQPPVLPVGAGQSRALHIAAHGDHDVHGRQLVEDLLLWLCSMSIP